MRSLIAFGDASGLEARITPTGPHSYATPEDGVTVFYGRDRGETNVEARTHPAKEWPDYGQDYEYLFRDGAWKYRRRSSKSWRRLDVRTA